MNKFKIFLAAKWDLFLKKRKNFLIFDGNNIPFFEYISKKQTNILFTRGEKLNLYILFQCFIKKKFNVDGYISEFIKFACPKVILTFIDNNPKFYTLYKYGNFKTIFVQNGLRSKVSDIFANKIITNNKNKKNFKVDFMFVFNKTIGKLYNSFVSGKVLRIGSFNNNKFRILKNKKKSKILIISTYRDYDKIKLINKNVSWGQFTKNDRYFVEWLILLAKKYKLEVDVLGRYSLHKNNKEYLYFKNFFKSFKFNYISNYFNRNTYNILDSYKFSFTMNSTLGIECLARGGRIGFFCNRSNKIPTISRKFGWMENFSRKGPFWTYENTFQEFNRIFHKVVFCKKENG